jgi:hypothetical protein
MRSISPVVVVILTAVALAWLVMIAGLAGGGFYIATHPNWWTDLRAQLVPARTTTFATTQTTSAPTNRRDDDGGGDDNSAAMVPKYLPLLDFDRLAARMTDRHDLYVRIRDQALAAYARNNPVAEPYDEQMHALLRFLAYNDVWGDLFEENLWASGRDYALVARKKGCDDPAIDYVLNYDWYNGQAFQYGARFDGLTDSVARMAKAGYPAVMQMEAARSAFWLEVAYKTRYRLTQADPPSARTIPALLQMWGDGFRQAITEKLPHEMLSSYGENLQEATAHNPECLDLAIAEQDRDFNETDFNSPVKLALDGAYFINAAWIARGSGFANTVTADGWRLFAARLSDARGVLEAAYQKYPNEEPICRLMMTVVLGQETGRPEMEKWFQRAIAADPHSYAAYRSKAWFLQPRWYGSLDDLLAFGQDCVKTQDWEHRIPMVFTYAIATADEQDHDVYTRDEVWVPIEKTYRDFLARYPDSIHYRTLFAKHAYDGDHRDVAIEQFKILGDNWDHAVLSTRSHTHIMQELGLK